MEHAREHLFLKRALFVLSIFITINLLILNFQALEPNVLGKSTKRSLQACPSACVAAIKNEVATIGGRSYATGLIAVKEHFVPIGTGSSAAEDWEDVPGLQVVVDTDKYAKIKEAFFEASVHVTGANQIVYVRLYNVTDRHPVWFSELVFPNAQTAASQTSPKITLDPGNKAYRVQMKTQLKFTATLDQSRIRIVTY